MIRIVNFKSSDGDLPLFIDDTNTGYNGKDILTKPGAYDDVTGPGFSLPIAELTGTIDGYSTKMMGLVLNLSDEAIAIHPVQDCTNSIQKLLTVPETAAKMLLAAASDDMREFMETALDTIHFYESVDRNTKVFLPDSAFGFVPEDVANSMRSSRHVYVLKSVDNQEFIQKDCQAPYGVVLPDVDDLHSDMDVSPSALDILRVIAPCRRELQPGVYQYNGIYHTPYFKVDPKIRGAIPSYLGYLNGYAKNDKLGIQSFERHMADNLTTFIRSDTARYVGEITTALLMATPFGQSVRRICACRSTELLQSLVAEIQSLCPNGLTVNLSYDDMKEVEGGKSAAALLKSAIKFESDALLHFVDEISTNQHIADTRNLPFVLDISDDLKEQLTAKLIEKSVISMPVHDHLIALCSRAYEVNWGHSGAARAIPRFVLTATIEQMDAALAAYVQAKVTGKPAPSNIDFSILYPAIPKQADEQDELDGGMDDDEIFTQFDYYITNDTAYKLRTGTLPNDYFFSQATGAETSESNIVEYWRKVNGTNNLSYFISSSFTATGDVGVLIESFLKLMRWGDVKPSMLMFPEYPSIRNAFDLSQGKETPNMAVVDESQLVRVNGCKYSIETPVLAGDIIGREPALVGLLLSSDYGVKKYTLASLVDVGEMVEKNAIDIADLKTVQAINIGSAPLLDEFANEGYDLYTSNYNIEKGIEYSVPPATFSELALLLESGILRSAEYLKAIQSSVVITTRDRQYQNLKTYADVVRVLYSEFKPQLSESQTDTVELAKICSRAYSLFVSGATKQAQDANEVRAASTIASLNLEGGSQYDDRELLGKFTIISDVQMQSMFPSIDFTDSQVKKLAERLSNRVVLLMLETDDAFVLCRKDISASELLIKDGKIEHKRYSAIAPLVDGLKQGRRVAVTDSKTGTKKPAKLHQSLAEYIV